MTAIEKRRANDLRLNIPKKRWTEKTGFPTFRKTGKAGVWNFWRDGITSSFLNVWNSCREQARLAYVEGWTARETPLSMEFGTCIHWCLEYAYKVWGVNKSFGVGDLSDQLRYVLDLYRKVRAELHPDPTTEALATQELVYGFAEIILPNYFKRWDGDITGKYTHMDNPSTHPKEFVSLEEEFCVPYVYPDGFVVNLRGKRDMVFLGKDGRERVLDTKCLSVIKDEQMMEMFPTDLQQMLYLLVRLTETGKMPTGSVKNIIRRPGHRRGCKKGIKEPLPDFFARVQKDVSDVSQWDQKGDEVAGWFIRFEMALTEGELLDWKRDVFDPMMWDLRMWFEGNVSHYPVHDHAVTKYGAAGMYGPVIKNDFKWVYQRNRPFPELTGA